MARTDRFMIAPISGGMQTDLKPWMIPDDAFQTLNNAYVFRGRVRKRFGSRLMEGSTTPTIGYQSLQSRLRIQLGTTDAGGAFPNGNVPGIVWTVGQAFSVGNLIFTVYQPGVAMAMLTTGTATGTYDTTNGAYTFTGLPALTAVYFYPATPVMGLITYQVQAVLNESIFAFDTQFAYQFTSTGWTRLGTAVWKGSDSQFFWGSTWRGASASQNYLFVTNYNAPNNMSIGASDPMYYWDGANWNTFTPVFDSASSNNKIVTARIILPFRNRLILLNVVENTGGSTNTPYVNRCRFSWIGDPTDATAFYDDVDGKGDYIDAPTKESIITAQFVKDRLIVYFEQSTWELASTGNEVLPFRWQQLNTEFGAESTFSQVPFDKVVLGVGNIGIVACNGSNVERIDNNIPDEVFEVHNANGGIQRVAGIRDYFVEMVYWTFPDETRSGTYPYNNKVLVYNYKTGSWALNDDSITAFGYYQSQANQGETWSSDLTTWLSDDSTWEDGPSVQALFRSVLAGNQEGFVFIVDPDEERNAPALQITNAVITNATTITLKVINHNLQDGFDGIGDYIAIENVQGLTGITNMIFPVGSVSDQNTFTIIVPPGSVTGSYAGGGTIARVSNIDITTKQYNFYVQEGYNASINKVDFLVDKTSFGQVTVDYYLSSSGESSLTAGDLTGTLVGNGTLETSPYALYPLESLQTRLWHPIYPFAQGECIQLNIYMTDSQLRNPDIAFADFELHAMTFYATKTSSRLQ